MKNPTGPASAAAAWARGSAGREVAWLARAARLAPDDPRLALDLARVRVAAGSELDLAVAALERLAARHDVLAVWLNLAIARHRLGDLPGAAAAVAQLLQRHCVPSEPAFATLAGQLAAAAGYGGFCGLAAGGEMVRVGQGRLLGEPLDMAALNRVEGLVTVERDGLAGWAARPAAQEVPPEVTLRDAGGKLRRIRFGDVLPADEDAPFLRRYRFRLPKGQLRGLEPPFTLRGPDGAHLLGSPADPAVLAIRPVPAVQRGPAVQVAPKRRPLAILIPLYRGLAEAQACLASVLAAPPDGGRIILIDDASPEPALSAWASGLAAAGSVLLLRHAENLGFAAAVNTGLAAARGHDVLLLNSDTLVPPGAIETLHGTAYAAADTGTLTPLSNEATILSYPNPRGGNAPLGLAETARLDALARQANGAQTAEIPTAVGFCMLIRHDCLAAAGGFRPEIFAQGYGEENDFCLRARQRGYANRAALGVFVAHVGGVSFRAAARGLIARNLVLLNRLYPGYHELVMAHIAADPLRPARARIDALRLQAADRRKKSVLLVSHSHGGGVARQVAAQISALRAEGLRPLLLITQFPDDPENTPYPWPALLTEGGKADYPNLSFTLPGEQPALLALLQSLRVTRVILHHALGHHPAIRSLASLLNVPQDIVIHDYASFCRRVNLLNRPDEAAPPRYCGEPDVKGCIACCARDPEELFDPLPVPELLARSRAELAAAREVTVPSADAARRITRHFPGISPRITPWEDDSAPVRLRPPANTQRRRVLLIGGIGLSKGFHVLLDCARDAAARALPLDFIIAGSSADDEILLGAGVFITGHYAEGEAQPVIAQCRADLAFFPSIWPETWCFTLGEAWRAGLYAIVFDLGAQAERVRATKRGATLPLGLPPSRINDFLLRWMPA